EAEVEAHAVEAERLALYRRAVDERARRADLVRGARLPAQVTAIVLRHAVLADAEAGPVTARLLRLRADAAGARLLVHARLVADVRVLAVGRVDARHAALVPLARVLL